MSLPERDIAAVCRWSGRPGLRPLLGAVALLGLGALLVGALGPQPLRAWQAYLINLLFWTGLAAGSVLFSAIHSITHASWGRPLKRLAEAPAVFLLLAPFLFGALYAGREHIFPWIAKPIPGKEAWLNVPFLFLRDGLGLLSLAGAALILVYLSVRREVGGAADQREAPPCQQSGEERVVVVMANIYAILYAGVLSLIAFDLMMSLTPRWYSTLFGAYYFIGSFYMGLAGLFVLAWLALKREPVGSYIGPPQLHKLGKLLLGFCLLSCDFFFTQFLVIWYGNLPEETEFIILLTRFEPWRTLSWVVLAVAFVLPFLVLLSRRIKLRPKAMAALAGVILIAMWLEKFLLIVPSLWHEGGLPLGLTELLISLGFFGLMALCIDGFFRRFPLIAFADPLLKVEPEDTYEEEVTRWA